MAWMPSRQRTLNELLAKATYPQIKQTNIPSCKPPNSNHIKGSKEAVCVWLTFKANAFERGLNGLDAVKGKDAEGVVGQVKRFDGRHGM